MANPIPSNSIQLWLEPLFAILPLVNDKIIDLRYSFSISLRCHRYFDIREIKLGIFQLFCPCYTFACRLVICEPRLASLFAILPLVNDKIIEFRYLFPILLRFLRYFDIREIKLGIFELFCPCYTFACRLAICELRLASLFAILPLVNDKITDLRYSFSLSLLYLCL